MARAPSARGPDRSSRVRWHAADINSRCRWRQSRNRPLPGSISPHNFLASSRHSRAVSNCAPRSEKSGRLAVPGSGTVDSIDVSASGASCLWIGGCGTWAVSPEDFIKVGGISAATSAGGGAGAEFGFRPLGTFNHTTAHTAARAIIVTSSTVNECPSSRSWGCVGLGKARALFRAGCGASSPAFRRCDFRTSYSPRRAADSSAFRLAIRSGDRR